MEINQVLDKLPKHLLSFVIDQPYNSYTARDHSIWRYVMRQNVRYLSQVAHHTYVDGLGRTGISIEEIPHMYGMNRILKDIGWAAVAVDGFIPPAAFMEFQAYHVLVIAADIRPIDQIEYTPAPDIIHEAAGHAPIIADPGYSDYLVRFGQIGSKAFSSKRDYQLYEAIRHLSIVKADPNSPKEDISEALTLLSSLEKDMGKPSEMAMIRNLHWWTVEYGLIGDLNDPKIYGAGLLSSIGESFSALNNGAHLLPYSLEAKNHSFDITTKQPQLFVTPDFQTLTKVLEEFAETMAIRRGGLYGVHAAINSGNTACCVYSSGLQVSGTFIEAKELDEEPVYLITEGPTCLSFSNVQLPGHGKETHAEGFGSPVGRLKGQTKPLEDLSEAESQEEGYIPGQKVTLEFASGVVVAGLLDSIFRRDDKIILMSFRECTVKYYSKVLFKPEWGIYDMAVGEKIISAFNGPADADGFELTYPAPIEKTHKIEHDLKSRNLFKLYNEVRHIRDADLKSDFLPTIWSELKSNHPDDWLLPMELYELLATKAWFPEVAAEIKTALIRKQEKPALEKLIRDGFGIIGEGGLGE
ncbi:MAG: aromatic amino acid hydroxylase [Bacteroidota bacterium]